MPEHTPHPDGQPEHPEIRTEPTDVSFGWILAVLVAAGAIGLLIHLVVWRFFAQYRDYQAEIKTSDYPLAPGPSTALPREPRLEQIDRAEGIQRPNVYLREATRERELSRYGRLEGETDFVHIPIDRAMTLLAGEGKLRARAEPGAGERSRQDGLVDGGEPNSGRLLRGKPR
jgi:hypothetical protein